MRKIRRGRPQSTRFEAWTHQRLICVRCRFAKFLVICENPLWLFLWVGLWTQAQQIREYSRVIPRVLVDNECKQADAARARWPGTSGKFTGTYTPFNLTRQYISCKFYGRTFPFTLVSFFWSGKIIRNSVLDEYINNKGIIFIKLV